MTLKGHNLLFGQKPLPLMLLKIQQGAKTIFVAFRPQFLVQYFHMEFFLGKKLSAVSILAAVLDLYWHSNRHLCAKQL